MDERKLSRGGQRINGGTNLTGKWKAVRRFFN
jgi:hypothetical protein